MTFADQSGYAMRFEWGEAAIRHLAPHVDAVIIVDVLSFSTATDVAVGRGGVVFPHRWKGDSAAEFAARHGALLANRDRGAGGYSLSPASLGALPPGSRLVLPSPNGATLSAFAQEGGAGAVFTACLRNAPAVAAYVGARYRRVLVVAAGERWPDGTLRPAVEDLWGAGAVISSLRPNGGPDSYPPETHSPEAQAAADAFLAAWPNLPERLRECSSGRELRERGFGEDLTWAAAFGVSGAVPQLRGGAYRSAGDPAD
ncbi:2-phosphosulfolactate phosphatase [Deinococcus altitudinis]|uniref:2-phosphosulfolactate phosphatase n=1 Tax=Deinococcus altitudinis TaxID=468914 RepID=UPI003891A764